MPKRSAGNPSRPGSPTARAASAPRRRAVFLDRDGVINVDRGYIYRTDQLKLTPTAVEGIRLANANGYLVIVVTNQSGVARGLFGTPDVEAFHQHLSTILEAKGAVIDAFYYCPFHPDGTVARYRREHRDRKPGPGMLLRATADWNVDPAASFMIGDRPRDLAAARAAGVRGLLMEADTGDLAQLIRDEIGHEDSRSNGKVAN